MLVDPTTRQGRQFIRDWGQDSNKMVLNFTWVNRSLEAQRPQLAEDKWGNCLAQDDGRPIDSGEELQDVVHDIEKRPKSVPFASQVMLSCCSDAISFMCKKSSTDTTRYS